MDAAEYPIEPGCPAQADHRGSPVRSVAGIIRIAGLMGNAYNLYCTGLFKWALNRNFHLWLSSKNHGFEELNSVKCAIVGERMN